MQNLLYLEILESVSDRGFSLDELVLKTKELFERDGMSGVVSMILSLVDEQINLDLYRDEGRFRPSPCCGAPHYSSHGHRDRRFRTSVGEVNISWRRVVCKNCGKVTIPLRDFLGLSPYQSKTNELERMVVEVVSEQSYRRSGNHLDLIGSIPVPKSTLHRWVADTDCDELNWPRGIEYLLADGSGFKRRPDPEKNMSNRGEVRVALGVDRRGCTLALGSWSGLSWKEIGEELGQKRGRRPKAKMLVSDGEPGLAEGLGALAKSQHRCHWHAVRDLNYMLWNDKSPKEERGDYEKELIGILGIELPPNCSEPVREEDKSEVSKRIASSEKALETLASGLIEKGYIKAASYVRRAKKNLFGHLRFWIKYGIVGPRASSRIERMMREIGRRLKRIAFGWSEKGAAKMARIIIKRFSSASQWLAYWLKKLRVDGNVIMVYRGVHVK